MVLPAETIITEGIEIRLIRLPSNTRVPTSYTLTVDNTGSPVAANSTEIPLLVTGSEDVYLEEGLEITIGGTLITVAANATVAQGASPTVVTVEPTNAEIADGSTGTTNATLQLLGVTSASPNFSSTVIDTTNFQSGFGQENQVTGINRTFSLSGNNILANRALDDQVKPFAVRDADARGEVWCEIIIPNSTNQAEIYAGAGKVSNYSETLELRNVQRYSFEITMQGTSFSWTPATTYT